MKLCTKCLNIIDRKTAKNNNGVCDDCKNALESGKKIQRDLLTAFAGNGKRGLVQWLNIGKFLQGLEETEDVTRHNDRTDVITALIGGPNKIDKLIDGVADVILKLAKEADEHN